MSFLGYGLLVLAAAAALYGTVAFVLGARSRGENMFRQGRLATFLTAGFMTLAVLILWLALFSHDFSLRYVASESSLDTPPIYLISALWAGNPGSLLFWGWLVAAVSALLLMRAKTSREVMSYALPVALITELFFLILIFFENPFTRLSPVPSDGIGMNPLLQNPGMIFHPPALLIGWALLLAPFAVAIGSLITRRLGNEWLATARRWGLIAWVFLGLGNLLGAWWAYYELGWGGYWAWDPVENAGLMPWLLLTAFLHSTMMQRRRGFNKIWNILLIVFSFILTIFGAYLTRSDILSSVHTFGATPAEPVFVVFMALMLAGSLWLVIARRKELRDEAGDDAFVSGETTFFVNNLLLITATAAIFIGTMYPFFSRILTGNQIERDAHFFNTVNVPVFLAIILLAGLCVLVGFKKPDLKKLGRSLIWPLITSFVLVVLLFIFSVRAWYALGAIFVLAFTFFATIAKWVRDVLQAKVGKRESLFKSVRRLFSGNRARYGGYIVHLGIILIALGITGSSAFETRRDDVILSKGGSETIQGYTLTYNGIATAGSQTNMSLTADIDVSRGGKVLGKLSPGFRYYAGRESTTSEAAVRSTLAEDLYIILNDYDEQETASFSVLVNPLVDWMWIGGIVLLLGGLWAFSSPPKTTPQGVKTKTVEED
jgi:cytochrome c-type biogenesis protein CcmF